MKAAKNDISQMYFSQYALETYDSCALKFRYRYIDGLYWPSTWAADPEQLEAIEQGQLFHLAARRYYSGIPVGPLEEPVKSWLEELKRFRPRDEEALFLPEQEIRLNAGGLKLLVKLDLLMVLPDGRAVIYDWKTTPHQPKASFFARSLQTIVYRYVLKQAGQKYSPKGDFSSEDISMIYWNPRYPHAVEPIGYHEEDFRRDEKILRQLIEEIKGKPYEEFYATGDTKKCTYCVYAPICHGTSVDYRRLEEVEDELDLDWESIEEFAWE
ncbi:MAG: PD-(D/E)XK nuclease family protein [Bacillota bacterium]